MRDFPSCFAENAVQIADSSSSSASKTVQNVVACTYQCQLRGRSCLITVTWSKSLMGQGLSVGIDDSANQSLCKVDMKWWFSKRKGSKTIEVDDSRTVDVYWDLSSAKFESGPEPTEGFYLVVVFERQTVLHLGDMSKEAMKKTVAAALPNEAALVAKKENMFGKKVFSTQAQFCDHGKLHDLMVECDTNSTVDPCLIIRVDRKNVLQVKRLKWKFRGNHTIMLDRVPVEFFWDVYNWLFSSAPGNAIFMFRTCSSSEKSRSVQSLADPSTLQWSHSRRIKESQCQSLGFSLILNAWKQE